MIASTSSWGLYILIRDLMRWVHPWWLRIVLVAAGVGAIFAIAFIQQVMEDRKRAKRRASYSTARLERYLAMRERYEHAPRKVEGTCAHWIPEGFG